MIRKIKLREKIDPLKTKTRATFSFKKKTPQYTKCFDLTLSNMYLLSVAVFSLFFLPIDFCYFEIINHFKMIKIFSYET